MEDNMEEKAVAKIDKEVEEETSIVVIKAAEIVVIDKITCDAALDMGSSVNALKKKINEFFDPMVKSAYATHKAVKTKQNEAIEPLDKAKSILANKITAYNIELKRQQQEEAEKQRKRDEAESEAEKNRLLAEADAAAGKDDNDTFEQKEYEASQVTPESVAPVSQPVEKVKGSSENWQAKVINKHALLKAVLAGTVLDEAIIPNDKFLRDMAKSSKGKIIIPGVVFEDIGTVRF